MSALREIQKMRKALENMEFVGMIQLAMHGDKKALDKQLHKWARQADVEFRWED